MIQTKESHCQTLAVISSLFSWWEEVIRLARHQTFHSLAWSGDEHGCIEKLCCLEIYQTSEEKWKIVEVCESGIRLQEVQWYIGLKYQGV